MIRAIRHHLKIIEIRKQRQLKIQRHQKFMLEYLSFDKIANIT